MNARAKVGLIGVHLYRRSPEYFFRALPPAGHRRAGPLQGDGRPGRPSLDVRSAVLRLHLTPRRSWAAATAWAQDTTPGCIKTVFDPA